MFFLRLKESCSVFYLSLPLLPKHAGEGEEDCGEGEDVDEGDVHVVFLRYHAYHERSEQKTGAADCVHHRYAGARTHVLAVACQTVDYRHKTR